MLYTVQQSLDHTSVWERRRFFATFDIPVVFDLLITNMSRKTPARVVTATLREILGIR